MSRRKRYGPQAFTLIELLVVVAIISLLISILLPALANAKRQSRQLLCSTNLRSQGQAAVLYGEDNNGWMLRGINDGARITYCVTVLRGLGYDGPIRELFSSDSRQLRPLREACRATPQLQCPDFPEDWQFLDYVASAFPIPQTDNNIGRDLNGGGNRGDRMNPENALGLDYVSFFRLTDFQKHNPAQFIYVTEAASWMLRGEVRFHHVFYASQLPFGGYPRIAADQRHPGGINAMFYDGHAQTMALPTMDAGWPNSLGIRLKWFTTVSEAYR